MQRPDVGAFAWRLRLIVAFLLAALTVCPSAQAPQPLSMNEIAERYVKLVLALGQHDPDYVDAYYGPPEWKTEAARQQRPLATIGDEAERLIGQLRAPAGTERGDELIVLRHQYLRRQLEAVGARVRMLTGATLSFDEESRALYDAVAPTHPESDFQAILDQLEKLLPGQGALGDRYEAFRRAFIVPPSAVGRVFDAAIAECRARTVKHVRLPATEHFRIEYVTNKPWGGYNWYQGNYQSLIQINTDLPIYIDHAINLACHEGYPGHHVYNALLEKQLVRDRGWVEMSVYALFSPQSLIAEGSANYGIRVAFPGEERAAFERDVLFPLAGLDTSRASEYYKVFALLERLTYAGNEAARRYLDKKIDRAETAAWLTRFAMKSPAEAEHATQFFDQYRSYVINYNLGMDLVKGFVESRAGSLQPEKRWEEFVRLLGSPRLPSGLRAPGR
jgi:hypothetical protein